MRGGTSLGLLLLTATLAGCAMPGSDNQIATDMTVCRRHAEQGPGGPSDMVGSGSFAAFMVAHHGARQRITLKEAVYLDCMRNRGYGMPGPQQPVDPERVGANGPRIPAFPVTYFP